MPHAIGSDVGGTFTDLVMLDDLTGRVLVGKVPSTPQDPGEAVMAGIHQLKQAAGGSLSSVTKLVHATTLVANTIIERAGVPTALLVTEGFRDILRLRRHTRISTYELYSDPPEPLIPYSRIFPVRERLRSDGTVLTPLDEVGLGRIARDLLALGVQSVAVVFLHSYVDPAHERRARDIIGSVAPSIDVTLSSDVVRRDMEYERASTTVANAYCAPIVGAYVDRLAKRAVDAGAGAELHLLSSSGGVVSPAEAARTPVRLVESGPAAGSTYTASLARALELPTTLAFDMGGTTAKGCLIRDGEIPLTDEIEIARADGYRVGTGFPLRVPSVEMIEFGAGGGSIVSRDEVGVLRVGPRSAGAVPGPACYVKGGTAATVTDAALIAGHLDPDNFLGGEMRLDRAAAERVLAEVRGAGDDAVLDVAKRVQAIVIENMASAITQHIIERGASPDDVTMVAFGGAGPIHADALARRMRVKRVLVPPLPGVLSALGLLSAAPTHQEVRTVHIRLTDISAGDLVDVGQEMIADVARVLETVDSSAEPSFRVVAQCSYVGQSSTIPVPLDDLALDGQVLAARFADEYRRAYGYYYDDVAVEVASLLVEGSLDQASLPQYEYQQAPRAVDSAGDAHRMALSHVTGQLERFAVVARSRLGAGDRLDGPVIVQERESTTIADVGTSVSVDALGNLVLELTLEGAK